MKITREEVFDEKADIFEKQANKLTKLGKQAVAQSSFGAEKKLKEVDQTTKKINDLTKQVISISMNYLMIFDVLGGYCW